MGLPITKKVTLAWDGVGWRDQETNFPVTGIKLLGMADDLVEKAFDPMQPNNGAVVHEVIQNMINAAFEARIITTPMHYFAPAGETLITYEYHRDANMQLHTRINELEHRIANLERPWWKRW
jgi:hypothetical protein